MTVDGMTIRHASMKLLSLCRPRLPLSLSGSEGGFPSWTRLFQTFAARPPDVGQPSPQTHPEMLGTGEILPGITALEFATRRRTLMERLPIGSVMIIAAGSVKYMSGIVPYPYRQEADFLYLTGCQQPGSVAVLQNHRGPQWSMFVPQPGSEVVWNGPAADTEAALHFFHADQAFPMAALPKFVDTILQQSLHVFYDKEGSWKLHHSLPALSAALAGGRVQSPRPVLHLMRWRKSAAEVHLLRRAASIACQSFLTVMRSSAKGSPREHELAAHMEFECRRRGAHRMAFPSVVAGGMRAATIHYSRNDGRVGAGDMVLLDAGCELHGYASDVTRVWPPSGTFSPSQRSLYSVVLCALHACLHLCRPGSTLNQIHQESLRVLGEGLSSLGLPQGVDLRPLLPRLYPTSVGHWLGMDVHDCSTVSHSRPLEPGVVLTVEPGLYIPETEGSMGEYAGMGVRIEEDVLITDEGHEVLTASIPKEIRHIEAYVTQARSFH